MIFGRKFQYFFCNLLVIFVITFGKSYEVSKMMLDF